ncbi:guanylyl cyclase 1-like [Rhododendron vialii]|uniref:guanylyl cyclase 1-like n=1 Tax=Rhododendron vialii TaxID=182163 RepID=UPI00265DF122|nr:guanylyl cyclase 1-like [Rhododendron vialii]
MPCPINARGIMVPLINQQRTWDCGLACILMSLCLTLAGIFVCSIWSIDLAFSLQKFSVRFSYFAITVGANPKFSVETFYKEQFLNDLVRVEMLFQKAIEAIRIQCRSTSGEEMSLLILTGKFVAIAIVDQYKLRYSYCLASFDVDCSQMLHYYKFPFYAVDLGLGLVAIQATLVAAQDTPLGTNAFTSCHYVVICGYNAVTDEFEIHDPASFR